MSERTNERAPKRRRGRPSSGGREAILAAATQIVAEKGASRLTTNEVARTAGVSEGTLFYHFKDRAGLMTAVIENGLGAFSRFARPEALEPGALHQNLTMFAHMMDTFLDPSLLVMLAAQSDSKLRDGMRAYMLENDMGPHRGINLLSRYLKMEQTHGNVDPDVDCGALAYLIYSACFQRSLQRLMFGDQYGDTLIMTDAIIATVEHCAQPARPNAEEVAHHG